MRGDAWQGRQQKYAAKARWSDATHVEWHREGGLVRWSLKLSGCTTSARRLNSAQRNGMKRMLKSTASTVIAASIRNTRQVVATANNQISSKSSIYKKRLHRAGIMGLMLQKGGGGGLTCQLSLKHTVSPSHWAAG